jgi:hypothetical protein
MTTLTIETLWNALRVGGGEARQQRVDANHPLDLYADFEPPDRPGLLLVTSTRPPERFAARSIDLVVGYRTDGRWSLRMTLGAPALIGVFAELCRDIIEFTRLGITDAQAGSAFLGRIERWRRLLDKGPPDLSDSAARGLIGELTVLLSVILPELPPTSAIASWTGPLGTPQDFMLPTGRRLEVKAVDTYADSVRINGLEQLDPGGDALKLVVVRLERTAAEAPDAITLLDAIERVRGALAGEVGAIDDFDRLLAFAGWDATRDSGELAVRITGIDGHAVNDRFPRLVKATVRAGVIDASYIIRLPLPTEKWVPLR